MIRKNQPLSPALFLLLMALFAMTVGGKSGANLWQARSTRSQLNELQRQRQSTWIVESPGRPWTSFYSRIDGTRYWSPRSHLIVSPRTELMASQGPVSILSPTTVTSPDSGPAIWLMPNARIVIDRTAVTWLAGSGAVQPGLNVRSSSGEVLDPKRGWIIFDGSSFRTDDFFATPSPGTTVATTDKPAVHFQSDTPVAKTGAVLEIATDSEFKNTIVTEPWSTDANNGNTVQFSDRAPGLYYARLSVRGASPKPEVIAVTTFRVVRFLEPHHLRPVGKRFLTFEDDTDAVHYRIEFSTSEKFESLLQSRQTQSRLIDLLGLTPGSQFIRVVSIQPNGKELKSLALQMVVPTEQALLQSRSELTDPSLDLLAKGWRIQLNSDEMRRLRDGYVILHDSEIRGIRPRVALDPTRFVFELSRDPAFPNPERVKPDLRGELLPPALPIGTLFVRLRARDADGTLGPTGLISRLTTLLPAPDAAAPQAAKVHSKDQDLTGFTLSWGLPVPVAGYEVRLSATSEFLEGRTHVIRTKANWRKVAPSEKKPFYWTVQAINEFGQAVSARSPVQTAMPIIEAKPIAAKKSVAPRAPANIPRAAPVLSVPNENAVIVGGARARRYGALRWDAEIKGSEKFEVEIATDNDFVNVVINSKTKKREFVLEGDLPEGSLFWRVRRNTDKQWSSSRRFELIYE